MKRKLFIAAILLQFLVLFFICGKRERIIRSGETVYLRTAPVDPRDIVPRRLRAPGLRDIERGAALTRRRWTARRSARAWCSTAC